ncbi:hypothetical protein [Streptomyces oceani]|uniref:Integral membrane protein n=1 Tax=Streptomyces oceani TaxID=1075402 RepID=A0A1E7JU08_9ACTN|nr:hypothetical protein [Streptomyces oceani]OEU93404.1 hypothetical protein AN216_24565 [Streptomyces oceani]
MTDARRPDGVDGPSPEPIRFFGTTWVDHTGGYALRRAGLVVGALALVLLGAFALRSAYEGLALAEVAGWVRGLVVVLFAVCSSVGFAHTLTGFGQRRPDTQKERERERSLRSLLLVGFIGVLFAYALRGLFEAPGERVLREEYDEAVRQHERRRTSRTGNPAKRNKRRR